MKRFLFKYTSLVWALLGVVVAISIAGVVYSVINFINGIGGDGVKIASSVIIALVNLFLLAFSISVLVYGRYVIKNGTLYTYFGFIRTKSPISSISKLSHYKSSDKLVAYFSDAKYTVIVISPKDYPTFIGAIKQENPSVYYEIVSSSEENG